LVASVASQPKRDHFRTFKAAAGDRASWSEESGQFSSKVAQVLIGNVNKFGYQRRLFSSPEGLPESIASPLSQQDSRCAVGNAVSSEVIYACRAAPPGIGNEIKPDLRFHYGCQHL